MPTTSTPIRDLREKKNLSEDKVAAACGLTYSKFVRIQEGSGKTTQEEIDHVIGVLKTMEPGTRKLAGRPFKDAERQAAVKAARENGTSVAAAIAGDTALVPSPSRSAKSAPVATEAAPAKPKRSRKADAAPAKRTRTPRSKK